MKRNKIIIITIVTIVALAVIFFYSVYSFFNRDYTGLYVNAPYENNLLSIDDFGQFAFEQLRDNRYDTNQTIVAQGSSFQAYSTERVESITYFGSGLPGYNCNNNGFVVIDMGELYTAYRYLGFMREPKLEQDEQYLWTKQLTGGYTSSYTWATAKDLHSLCLGTEFEPNSITQNPSDTEELQVKLTQYITATIENQNSPTRYSLQNKLGF